MGWYDSNPIPGILCFFHQIVSSDLSNGHWLSNGPPASSSDNKMISVGFPDWKKIGWRVGKKLRDIINPPADTGPSPEERRAQRLRDGSRGLVYFDDFDELEAWSAEDVDPVQQANMPLLKRSASQTHDQVGRTTLVLLCHDYSGGYHDYESVRPSLLEDKMYACNYPQHVDTFVYFSHKLVCVPPPTWINPMHRNGVKVLGTFIVEPGTTHVMRMLDQVNGEFIVAKQLAAMVCILSEQKSPFPDHYLSCEALSGSKRLLITLRAVSMLGLLSQSSIADSARLMSSALTDGCSISNWSFPSPSKILQGRCVR